MLKVEVIPLGADGWELADMSAQFPTAHAALGYAWSQLDSDSDPDKMFAFYLLNYTARNQRAMKKKVLSAELGRLHWPTASAIAAELIDRTYDLYKQVENEVLDQVQPAMAMHRKRSASASSIATKENN